MIQALHKSFRWLVIFWFALSTSGVFSTSRDFAIGNFVRAKVVDESKGSIQGTLVLSSTNQDYTSLQYIAVRLYKQNSCGQKKYLGAITPAFNSQPPVRGVFTFKDLLPGTYFVHADANNENGYRGYLDGYYDQKESLSGAAPITISANITSTISMSLNLGGQIFGIVTDASTGQTITESVFTVYGKNPISQQYAQFGSVYFGLNGPRSVASLPPGEYFAVAHGYYYYSDTHQYAPQFYGGSFGISNATPISVTYGSVITIGIALTKGAQITGVVTEAGTGLPLEGVQILVRSTITDVAGYSNEATDSKGQYTTHGLPFGNYTIEFFNYTHLPKFYDGQADARSANTITITSTNTLPNINASLQRGSIITGSVTFTDGLLGQYARVEVLNALTNNVVGYGIVDSGSRMYYISRIPPGNYKIRFGSAEREVNDCYLSFSGGYYDQKPDADSATVINLTTPQTIGNINGILSIPVPSSTATAVATTTPTVTPTTTSAPTTSTPPITAKPTATATPIPATSTATSAPTITTTPSSPTLKYRAHLPLLLR